MGAFAPRAAAALCLTILAATVAGCGGDDHGGGAAAKSAGTSAAASTAPATGPTRLLSQQELEKAAAGRAELPGWTFMTIVGHTADGDGNTPALADVRRFPAVKPAACQPLSRMTTSGMSNYQVHALTEVVADRDSDDDSVPGTNVQLTAYEPQDALKVLPELRAALASCTSFGGGTDTDHYTAPHVVPSKRIGDDSVVYDLTTVVEDDPSVDAITGDAPSGTARVPYTCEVVRVGSVIAVYWVQAAVGQRARIPQEVVAAQTAKLRTA